MAQCILRLPAVLARNGISRSSQYAQISAGLFIKPVRLGARAVGYPENEVHALLNARVAGKSDDEIRQLVRELEAARKGAA